MLLVKIEARILSLFCSLVEDGADSSRLFDPAGPRKENPHGVRKVGILIVLLDFNNLFSCKVARIFIISHARAAR